MLLSRHTKRREFIAALALVILLAPTPTAAAEGKLTFS
jgi:hypothetical protein